MTRLILSLSLILSTACATSSQVKNLEKQLAAERAERKTLEEQVKAAPPPADNVAPAPQMVTDIIPPPKPGTIFAHLEVPRHCKGDLAGTLTNETENFLKVIFGGQKVIVRGVSGWQAEFIPPRTLIHVCVDQPSKFTVVAKAYGQRTLSIDRRGNTLTWEPVDLGQTYSQTAHWDMALPHFRDRHHHEIKPVYFSRR